MEGEVRRRKRPNESDREGKEGRRGGGQERRWKRRRNREAEGGRETREADRNRNENGRWSTRKERNATRNVTEKGKRREAALMKRKWAKKEPVIAKHYLTGLTQQHRQQLYT